MRQGLDDENCVPLLPETARPPLCFLAGMRPTEDRRAAARHEGRPGTPGLQRHLQLLDDRVAAEDNVFETIPSSRRFQDEARTRS